MDILSTSSQVVDLGRMDYETVRKIQLELVRRRKGSGIGNFLIFVEHYPVYTIGRKADPANFMGINPIRTERGGDVTYHGPGQLVTYIIMDIRRDGRIDVRGFVNAVTEKFISAIRSFGFDAHPGVSEPGIWVGNNPSWKVGSIGICHLPPVGQLSWGRCKYIKRSCGSVWSNKAMRNGPGSNVIHPGGKGRIREKIDRSIRKYDRQAYPR